MNIIKFAIENPVKVIVGIFFLVIFGIQALFNMPYRLIPTIEYPQITVRTSWTGASPYEMEKEVVDRQERVLKTIPGLVDFESMASNGFSSITLMFDLDMDINDAILNVLNKLNEVRGYPDNVDQPTIRSSNTDSISVIELALTTTDDNPKSIDEYGTYFEEIIKPYLERVEGVADLSYWGGSARQIHIKVDPNLLSYYNLSISQVVSAFSQENVNISAGTLDFGSRDYRFRTIGEVKTPDDIKEIVIVAGDNSRVKMGDIAEIDYGFAKKNTIVRLDTKDAINVGVIAQSGANVLKLTDDVEAVINNLNDGILKEQGIEFVWVSDQRGYILKAIALVKSNIAVGGILAVIVLLLFLRSIRSTLVIATTIPISVIGTFFIMNAFGKSLNVISLAGIAFSVGMLIDNAIVVLENIDRHMSMGKSPYQAAYDGVKEVWGAILASTLTTVAVFLPVVFIKEEAGQLFGDIALAVSSAVGISLVVSVLVIPVFTRLLYSKGSKKRENNRLDNAIIKFGSFFSDSIMTVSTKINSSVFLRLAVIILITVFSAGGAYLLMPKMDYLPLGNKNLVESRVSVPPGYSYPERAAMGEYIYKELEPYIGKEKDGYPAIKTFMFVGGSTMVRLSVTS
ncbi:MAG: efflux RND transporter permease subunit, partial [Deferribacterales bacterium]|nr:efflux RND transporter permease subunit [Deferribacterales bacterium]